MSVRVNVHMSKIMRTAIKLGVHTYNNCRILFSTQYMIQIWNSKKKPGFQRKLSISIFGTN